MSIRRGAMRVQAMVLGALLGAIASAAPAHVSGQRADRRAVEVILEALPPGDRAALFSRAIGRDPGAQGRATLDAENEAALERLGYVEVTTVEEAVLCPNFPSPDGCRVRDGGVFYQLVMPEPISEGRLTMRVVMLIDGAGTNGEIRREVWDVLMVQDAELGWRAVRKRLDQASDGPW